MDEPALIEATARALCLSDKRFPCNGCKEITEDHDGTCDAPRSFLDDQGYVEQATAALVAHDAWLRSAGMELARRRLGELNECAPISDCPDCEQGLTTSCRRRAEAVLGEK